MIYSFIHGEGLMRFIIVMYALGMIAWAAIIYGVIMPWQHLKSKKNKK